MRTQSIVVAICIALCALLIGVSSGSTSQTTDGITLSDALNYGKPGNADIPGSSALSVKELGLASDQNGQYTSDSVIVKPYEDGREAVDEIIAAAALTTKTPLIMGHIETPSSHIVLISDGPRIIQITSRKGQISQSVLTSRAIEEKISHGKPEFLNAPESGCTPLVILEKYEARREKIDVPLLETSGRMATLYRVQGTHSINLYRPTSSSGTEKTDISSCVPHAGGMRINPRSPSLHIHNDRSGFAPIRAAAYSRSRQSVHQGAFGEICHSLVAKGTFATNGTHVLSISDETTYTTGIGWGRMEYEHSISGVNTPNGRVNGRLLHIHNYPGIFPLPFA
jgi:hypothetical protein